MTRPIAPESTAQNKSARLTPALASATIMLASAAVGPRRIDKLSFGFFFRIDCSTFSYKPPSPRPRYNVRSPSRAGKSFTEIGLAAVAAKARERGSGIAPTTPNAARP